MLDEYIDRDKALFLIVGKGSGDGDYLTPLRKAIAKSEAHKVFLLCSNESRKFSEAIKEEYCSQRDIEIICFAENNMEFDADKCYCFFDELFKKILENGVRRENLIIDFTHGTKPMSAALYAVGMRYRFGNFQYVVRKKNADGQFADGEETVRVFDASPARWQAVLDECRILFANCQFAAAKALLEQEKPPRNLQGTINKVKILADFYGAWDRLDYVFADNNYPDFSDKAGFLSPPPEAKEFIASLKEDMKEPDDDVGEVLSAETCARNKHIAENLMFDIYANGLRRLKTGQLEDAGIRAYRLAELLGQIYLFEVGYMSNHMSASDEKVRRFAENKKIHLKGEHSDIYRPFGRKNVIDFLEYIKYPQQKTSFLKSIEKDIENIRNQSILIHGYSSKANDAAALNNIFEKIIQQLRETENFETLKGTALFMNGFMRI